MCVGNTHPWETHITVTPVYHYTRRLVLCRALPCTIADVCVAAGWAWYGDAPKGEAIPPRIPHIKLHLQDNSFSRALIALRPPGKLSTTPDSRHDPSRFKMNYLSTGIVVDLLILMLLFICYAEALEANPEANPDANPSQSISMRRRRFLRISCPNIWLICPTQQKYFVVRSARKGFGCKLQGSILHTALKECDNGFMDQCRDKWVNEHNNFCSNISHKEIIRSSVSWCLHFARSLLCSVKYNTSWLR